MHYVILGYFKAKKNLKKPTLATTFILIIFQFFSKLHKSKFLLKVLELVRIPLVSPNENKNLKDSPLNLRFLTNK